MGHLGELFERSETAVDYLAGFRRRMGEHVASMDVEGAARLVEVLESAGRDGRTVFTLGNGGSAAVAAHWVNDLGVNTVVPGRPGFRVIGLADNVSALTAVGNDLDFSQVFTVQLKAAMSRGDVVIALSVSGMSPNVVDAVEYANAEGGLTVGFTGMDGGKLRDIAQLPIHTPSDNDEYGPIEDVFSLYMHAATGLICQRRGRVLHH